MKAGVSHDISIQNPSGNEVGLMLARDPQTGRKLWERTTEAILPFGAPPGAIKPESKDPMVQAEYAFRGADLGVGFKRHVEGGRVAGLSTGVDTRFADSLFCGPKVSYIGDAEIATGVDFETWSGGLPTPWTKINGAETVAQETTIKHGGASSVKVTSAGAGHGIKQAFTATYFRQARLRLRCWVYAATGEGDPTVRIALNTGNTDGTTSTKDAWTQIDVGVTLDTTVLSQVEIRLLPATNDEAYFDDVQFTLEYLVGPGGPFTELEISGTDRLFHASGKTVFRLNTTKETWEAWDSASAGADITDLITHGTTMYRALGGSTLWQLSTDGVTWTNNGRSGDDRYANRFAVTWSRFGSLLLWKSLLPNKLAVTATPDTGAWTTYEVGAADTDIVDLVVVENLLYVIKEDGVYSFDFDAQEWVLLTPEWNTLRYARQGFGGAPWQTGKAYIPAGRQALWEFDPASGTRRPIHPGVYGSEAIEYSGKSTRVIGDGSWLYVFLQSPASAPDTTQLMAGRPIGTAFRWGHLSTLDAGRVDFAWITATQFRGPRLYWSALDLDTNSPQTTGVTASAGAGANRDVGNEDWSNPGNVIAADDARATFVGAGTSAGPRNPTASAGAGTGDVWSDRANVYASDNARASAAVSPGAFSERLRATGFGFTIPATATILGIEVRIEGYRDTGGPFSSHSVRLMKGASEVGTAPNSELWPEGSGNEAYKTFGGAATLWGETWTPADINAATFGVSTWVYNTHSTSSINYYVDHIDVKVYYSVPSQNSDNLDTSQHGFAIPTTATINGIAVRVERSQAASGSVKDVTAQLLKAGAAVGDNKADTTTTWPTSDTVKTYGGSTDLWGTTWTAAEVNATNFGFTHKVEANGGVDTARVDHIEITVYYTPAGGSELDNRVGFMTLPTTENPRHCFCQHYATGGKFRTGVFNRFPGWKTAWQEVTIKTSVEADERLGSGGRQVTVRYNIFDGNGWQELGGSGNGVFSTSPTQTKFFKSASVASVVSEDIELELELATSDDETTPVIEEVTLVGTVRPIPVNVYEFVAVLTEGQSTLDEGVDSERAATKVAALRAMQTPQWAATLRDREGEAHQVYTFPRGGYREIDIADYESAGERPEFIRAVTIRCFEVPNSGSWG